MRKLSLNQLYSELLSIKVNSPPIQPRFDDLLEEVRKDLKKVKEWQFDDPDSERPLSDWWTMYADLADYLRE